MTPLVDMMYKQELSRALYRIPNCSWSLTGRDLRKRFQRFYNAHVAGMFAPAYLPLVVGPALRGIDYSVIKSLESRYPVNPTLYPGVIPVAEPQ